MTQPVLNNFLRWHVLSSAVIVAALRLPCQAATPTNITSSPSSGAAIAQTFSVSATDSAGWQDINRVMFMIYASSSSTCVVEIFPSTDQLYLMSADASSWLGPITAGSGSLNNTACTLYGSGSSYSGAGNTVTGSFSLAFSSSLAGTWPIYGAALDNASNSSGWVQTGSFTTAPTITGVNAFWYLGGVLSDRGYYAQASWSATANGASGTPTWNVTSIQGGGNVSLSCYTCSSTTATSLGPSNGCTYDVTVYLTYPDGSQSVTFNVAILTPSLATMVQGYPRDFDDFDGYESDHFWTLTDACGRADSELDGNEQFGTWTDDYSGNTWGFPMANAVYNPGSQWGDTMSAYGSGTPPRMPPTQNPQNPLGTTKIHHDYPWTLYVGSQTFGAGEPARQDTQQYYQDHGRHQ